MLHLWQKFSRVEHLLTAMVEECKAKMSPEAFQERFQAFMRDQRWKHYSSDYTVAAALAQSLAAQTFDIQQLEVTCD